MSLNFPITIKPCEAKQLLSNMSERLNALRIPEEQMHVLVFWLKNARPPDKRPILFVDRRCSPPKVQVFWPNEFFPVEISKET